ncbi:unnamed protein product [Lactuca saligna]|uniref:Uncharacterized protein n=1 Tax=Lactuca saligna TaxID=75948 RepID=A0AA35ZZ85_LACSI|nr:unnamed protein product [Lactuca saligna]
MVKGFRGHLTSSPRLRTHTKGVVGPRSLALIVYTTKDHNQLALFSSLFLFFSHHRYRYTNNGVEGDDGNVERNSCEMEKNHTTWRVPIAGIIVSPYPIGEASLLTISIVSFCLFHLALTSVAATLASGEFI